MLGALLGYEMIADSPEENGEYGEMIVNSIIKLKVFGDQERYLIKDLYIEDDRGVHQIDHIFIFKNGVFVVETKMFGGKILGKEDDQVWTAYYSPKETIPFVNPLKQNESHIRALKYKFKDMFDFQSVIVFPNNNKPLGCPDNVLNFKELKHYFLDYKPKKELSSEEMQYLKGALEDIAKNRKELRAKHREKLKALRKNK